MPNERTCVLLKPGVLQRRIVGDIISRLEKKGFKIIGMKMTRLSRSTAEEHYREHQGKYFFEPLVDYITSGNVIAMVVEREDCIEMMRKIAGATDPVDAEPGTIRGDFGVMKRKNIIHSSDSADSAAREIDLFFTPEEIFHYEDGNAEWY